MAWLQHDPGEGPGAILDWARARGYETQGYRCDLGEIPSLEALRADLVVVMGGPQSIYDTVSDPWLARELDLLRQACAAGLPMVGVCLGCQALAAALGAATRPAEQAEIGWFPVRTTPEVAAWAQRVGLPEEFHPLHWHGDTFEVPAGAIELGHSAAGLCQGFVIEGRVLAMQFHLETSPAMLADWKIPGTSKWRDGEYCQSLAAIVAQPERFEQGHRLLFGLLDALVC